MGSCHGVAIDHCCPLAAAIRAFPTDIRSPVTDILETLGELRHPMTTVPYIYDDLPFKRFFYYSVFFHLTLSALTLISIWIQRSGNAWGGVGGGDSGVKVNLVPSAG